MPALFPLLAIVGVFVFISTHAAISAPKPKSQKSSSSDLAQALEKMIESSNQTNGRSFDAASKEGKKPKGR